MKRLLVCVFLEGLLFFLALTSSNLVQKAYAVDCSEIDPETGWYANEGVICNEANSPINYCCSESQGWVCNDHYIAVCSGGNCSEGGWSGTNVVSHNQCAMDCGSPNCAPQKTCNYNRSYNQCCASARSQNVDEYTWSDGSGVCNYVVGACNQVDPACAPTP